MRAATNPVHVEVLAPNAIALRAPRLFGATEHAPLRDFVERVFAVRQVARLDLCTRSGSATLHLIGNPAALALAMQSIAAALGAQRAADARIDALYLPAPDVSRLSVRRYGESVGTWEIVHALPGRLRLRHAAIRRHPRRARYVEQRLRELEGVVDAQARASTGSLLLLFDPARLKRADALRAAEAALLEAEHGELIGFVPRARSLARANSALALALAGELIAPPLLFASALMLIVPGVQIVRRAAAQLARGRVDVPTVEASIFTLTLATGHFVPAALMQWLIDFWDQRFHERLRLAQQRLLAACAPRPLRVRLRQDALEVEAPLAALRAGQVVALQAGDLVPADGRVLAGEAEIGGTPLGRRALRVAAGDAVRAGSCLLAGRLLVRADCAPGESRDLALQQLVAQVTRPAQDSLASGGKDVARRSALPSLASAGLALAIGDAATALAALRPDYASGPGMSDPVHRVQAVAAWLEAGLCVCTPRVFEILPRIGAVVIEASACAGDDATQLERLVERLRREHGLEILLLRDASPAAMRGAVDAIVARGAQFAFVGSPLRHPETATRADLVIAPGAEWKARAQLADVTVEDGCWGAIDALWRLSAELQHARRSNALTVLVPNAACVAGALVLGWPGLVAIAVTNLATLRVYARSVGSMRAFERRLRHARLAAPAPEGAVPDEALRYG